MPVVNWTIAKQKPLMRAGQVGTQDRTSIEVDVQWTIRKDQVPAPFCHYQTSVHGSTGTALSDHESSRTYHCIPILLRFARALTGSFLISAHELWRAYV